MSTQHSWRFHCETNDEGNFLFECNNPEHQSKLKQCFNVCHQLLLVHCLLYMTYWGTPLSSHTFLFGKLVQDATWNFFEAHALFQEIKCTHEIIILKKNFMKAWNFGYITSGLSGWETTMGFPKSAVSLMLISKGTSPRINKILKTLLWSWHCFAYVKAFNNNNFIYLPFKKMYIHHKHVN